ncbi:MAG: hypothetical protein BAW33_00650, partial [Desulfobacterales bacterium C00003104]
MTRIHAPAWEGYFVPVPMIERTKIKMKDQSQQTNSMQESYYPDDDIELIDYLRVIWKWKYLIIAGVLICAIAAGVVSFSMPKVYGIDMIVRPGILTVGTDGKNFYIDSAENIKAIIEAGAFDVNVLDHIGKSGYNSPPKLLNLKANIPANSNALKISYETSDADCGLRILTRLGEVLLERYAERVVYFQNEHATEIGLKRTEQTDCEAKKRSAQEQIKSARKRIDELTAQVESVRKNTDSLIQERDRFLSKSASESNILSAVLYTNTIQQNMELENTCREQINYYDTRMEQGKLRLEKLNSESSRLQEQIRSLEFKKKNVQNIEVLQPPTRSPYPIKPKTKLNVMLAAVVGLFVMLFLAFFLEYIQQH